MFLIFEKEHFDEFKQPSIQLQSANFIATIDKSNNEIVVIKSRYGHKGVISQNELKKMFDICCQTFKFI